MNGASIASQSSNTSIWIQTPKYSTLFRRILETYTQDVEIVIDGKHYFDNDLATLLTTWCTNKRIKQTHNFRLNQHGIQLFSLHDGPLHVLAAYSELPFIQQLYAEQIIHYETIIAAPNQSISTWFKTMIVKLLAHDTLK